MSISRQNLSIVIVTFKSEGVIHECIKSIDKDIKIIVVENSNNHQFKNNLQQSAFAMDDYKKAMRTMKSNLINPQPKYMTDDRTYF